MSNFIHDIEISNFKSIRHQKIEGCKRINVFIGYPNVGKSNILEAIGSLGIVEKVLEQRRNPNFPLIDFVRLENLPGCFFQGNLSNGDAMIISNLRKVFFEWDAFSGDLRYSCHFDEHLKMDVVFDADFLPAYNSISNSFVIPPTDDALLSIIRGHVYKYSFRDFTRKSANRLSRSHLQFPLGENIGSSIQLIPDLKREVTKIFDGYGFETVFENGNLRLLKRINSETVFTIGIQSTADTLQRLIFYKAAIASNNDAILIFEEPEAHMFPPYIKLFTNDIVDKKTNQYFIATHSPFVVNELMEHALDELNVYTVGLENGETKIKRLTDEELQEVRQYGVDLFFNLESYL